MSADPIEILDALLDGEPARGQVPALLGELAALATEVVRALDARALADAERRRIYSRAVLLATPPQARLLHALHLESARQRRVAAGGAALAAVVGLAVLRGWGHGHGHGRHAQGMASAA